MKLGTYRRAMATVYSPLEGMMLVLSRKTGQQIILGEVVEITVIQIRGNKVRLGITAPRHISVNRAEARRLLECHLEQPELGMRFRPYESKLP